MTTRSADPTGPHLTTTRRIMRTPLTLAAAVAAGLLTLSACGAGGGDEQTVGSESDGVTTLTEIGRASCRERV